MLPLAHPLTCATLCASGVRGSRAGTQPLARLSCNSNQFGGIVEHLKLGLHIWVAVLLMGTMWRILTYHLIASPNDNLMHLGRAMAQQY